MKSLKQHRPLILAIATGIIISSCSKSSVKPKTQTKTIYTVSTLAGSGTAGSGNGIGVTASFSSPSGVAVSSGGILYVADFGNSMVRTVNTSTGAVNLFAGTGVQGFLNGAAVSAKFNGSANIVFDKSGNIFIADEQNNAIREISTSGNVTTVAGAGVSGYQDGPAATAQFNHPEGVVFDASGNLYVVESANNVIRKINLSTATVSTYAGSTSGTPGFTNGILSAATFHSPYGITMDVNGNMYVADIVNNCIRKITVSTGMVSTFAGSGSQGLSNGPAATATFFYPAGVAFDSKGNLYVAELRNNTIREVSTAGMVTTYAGTGAQGATDGLAASATFYQPIGLTFDSNGSLYVADEYNNKIRKITITH